jgi:hypothetical protein
MPGSRGSDQKYFFVHVMKTAGATLYERFRGSFGPDEVFPAVGIDPDMRKAYFRLDHLTALPKERISRTRFFSGHFPLVAIELLGIEAKALTIFRDPVERTISLLRARRETHGDERRLEEIYEDPFLFPAQIHNHQSKLFSLTASDRFDSYLTRLDVDSDRLAVAKANLERIDLIGLQERFEAFCEALEQRYGWRRAPSADRHVSRGSATVAVSFRRRIAVDNEADMELYERATELAV